MTYGDSWNRTSVAMMQTPRNAIILYPLNILILLKWNLNRQFFIRYIDIIALSKTEHSVYTDKIGFEPTVRITVH